MYKVLLTATAALATLGGFATDYNTPENVTFKTACFALRISPNGKWVGNFTGYAKVYDVENDEMTEYPGCTLSQGNSVSNDGVVAAGGSLLKDGEIIHLKTAEGTGGFDVEGITPDGKHVCGGWRGGPFTAELDENYNVVNPVRLPTPSTDLFGDRPQWINATMISADGNTIAGQIQDGYGMFLYPIIYYNSPEGWKYTIPIEDLFNPNGIEIGKNPLNHQPEYPYPEDYMSDAEAALYQEAYRVYLNGGGKKPDPAQFMSEEEYQRYVDAVDEYNDWYYSSQEDFKNYLNNYYAIVESTPSFNQGELAIHPSGEFVYMNGGIKNEFGQSVNYMYEMGIDGVNRLIPLADNNLAPVAVLSDGTLLSSPTNAFGFNTYLLEPGTEEFINIIDYLAPQHPEIAAWIDDSFVGMSGLVNMSDDRSRIMGTIFVTQLNDELYATADFRYGTYFINIDPAGVESIETEPADGVYRVFNLQGLKVLETRDASALRDLPKGLFIINGKKVLVN